MIQLTPTQEKLFNYLATHKRPVSIKKLSGYFLLHPTTVGDGLRALRLMGLADYNEVKGCFFYKIKR